MSSSPPRSRSRASSAGSSDWQQHRRPRHRGNRCSEREELRWAARDSHDIRGAFGKAVPMLPKGPAAPPPSSGPPGSQGGTSSPQLRHGDRERHELRKAAKGSGDIRQFGGTARSG
jgi:hypothetical protein